eukprot:SAG11_NODE_237_length_11835_cov_11.023347_4_plen_1312_part_00
MLMVQRRPQLQLQLAPSLLLVMSALRLLCLASAATASAAADTRAVCDNSTFPTKLRQRQYMGLSGQGVTATDDACRAKCCAAGLKKCNVWLRAEVEMQEYPVGSCFIGIAQGFSGRNPVWSGERIGEDPAPPPPPAPVPADLSQQFVPVPMGSAPGHVLDLASDSAWTASVDGAASRAVVVPGGGYNSDMQPKPWIDGYNAVRDNVTYVRKLVGLHAQFAKKGATLLEFGGVAHGAEVFVEPIKGAGCSGGPRTKVAQHWGPMMPFAADVSHSVHSSCDLEITVVAHHFRKLAAVLGVGFIYNEPWVHRSQWQSRNAFGITKSIRLAAYGVAAITDVVTHTSVSESSFGFDAMLANFATTTQEVKVLATIKPWGATRELDHAVAFPSLPVKTVSVKAGQNVSISVRDVAWTLGNASYWWPNKPFREDFVAKLQVLTLSVQDSAGAVVATAEHRFGFVEWAEALHNETWYTVNGRRINFISDATPEAAMSTYDCYTTSPAFNTIDRAKETWRRYMRMGMSANRIHQSTPTQIMLDAADEVGFALQPETAIRGECPVNKLTGSIPSGYTDQVMELAQVSRGHPSVFSYSLQNECNPNSIPALLDAISTVDTDRPYVWNDNKEHGPTRKVGLRDASHHAFAMLHYKDLSCPRSHSFAGGICAEEPMITGLGECAWCIPEGLESFAAIAVYSRQFDISYVAGWDWINYWPNFLEGMNYTAHAWKQTACVNHDRTDGVDGWNSSVIEWVQRAFHPHLVFDVQSFSANPRFTAGWPTLNVSMGAPGQTITRELVLFNDVVDEASKAVELRWSGHWGGDATRKVVVSGSVPRMEIEAGFHASATLEIKLPVPPAELVSAGAGARLQLVMELTDPASGAVLYTEDRVAINVTTAMPKARTLLIAHDKPFPRLNFSFEPQKLSVWFNQSQDGCNGRDTPDQSLVGFRRLDGTVVAFSGDDDATQTGSGFYAMSGPSLTELSRDCEAAVLHGGNRSSPQFADPSIFPHSVWLSAVWSEDGKTVHGLAHDEYHPKTCPAGDVCWYTTVLQVLSTDGGRSFTYTTTADNPRGIALSSPVPYRSSPREENRPQGIPNHHLVQDPRDGNIYVLASCGENALLPSDKTWPGLGGPRPGAHCVYRTTPDRIGKGLSAWRGWDGHGFDATVVDPYASPTPSTVGRLPAPVGRGLEGSGGVIFLEAFGLFVAVGAHCTQVEGQPPLMHVTYETSSNMTSWSGVLSGGSVPLIGPGSTLTCASIYPHLIDAASPSRNFDVIGRNSTSETVFFQVITGDRFPGPTPGKQASRAGLFVPVTIELDRAIEQLG